MTAFSLILATVGRTAELDRLFHSLALQTFDDFEVVVVDQNADERLVPHLDHARSLGVAVRHIKHRPPNLAAARNAGIDAARGAWLGFPDDDCWYEASTLARVATRFSNRYPLPLTMPGSSGSMGIETPAGVIVHWAEQGQSAVMASQLSWARSSRFRDIPVSSITLFFRRAVLDCIGGFDSRFGVGQWFGAAEETDLVLRALHSGACLLYEPDAKVHHALATGPAPSPAARLAARRRARGTGALYAKHDLPRWVILRGLLAPIARPVLKGSFGAELAHGYAVAQGRLDGFLGWRRRQS